MHDCRVRCDGSPHDLVCICEIDNHDVVLVSHTDKVVRLEGEGLKRDRGRLDAESSELREEVATEASGGGEGKGRGGKLRGEGRREDEDERSASSARIETKTPDELDEARGRELRRTWRCSAKAEDARRASDKGKEAREGGDGEGQSSGISSSSYFIHLVHTDGFKVSHDGWSDVLLPG